MIRTFRLADTVADAERISASGWDEAARHFSCAEADVLIELFSALGLHTHAEAILLSHRAADDDPSDLHYQQEGAR